MDNLSPAARDTLLALPDGPCNVHEVAERTGRSRSGTDKALRELAKQNLIAKVEGGDPADGAPARWQLTPAGHDTAQTIAAASVEQGTGDEQAGATAEPATDPADVDPADATQPVEPDARTGDQPQPDQAADEDHADQAGAVEGETDAADATSPEGGAGGDVGGEDTDPPKLCRGCGTQQPKICPHCWQKTPGYCGTCRQQMPQAHRGEPGEPSILPSGLPRLRPGELEKLVLGVIQQQPLPLHVGIKGWTAQRVAIYLPGRSTGAIGNALTKLTRTGQLELIGENPMRFQLTNTGDTNPQEGNTAAESEGGAGS
jgi:DNA-binding MarR family transcriptional regulator